MWRAIQGAKREAVAEAGVDRVLEVRVRVDEARHDRRVREALALAELRGRSRPRRSAPSSIATAPSSIGAPSTGSTQSAERTLTGRHRGSLVGDVPALSMNAASQIETSKRTSSGTASRASETGSTVGEEHGEHDHQRDPEPPVASQPVGA